MTNRVSGPPLGEAPARSSLVPRDLTAELCLIALASLGLLPLSGTFYGVFESARSILCLSLRITFCSVYALRCFGWSLFSGVMDLVFSGCV